MGIILQRKMMKLDESFGLQDMVLILWSKAGKKESLDPRGLRPRTYDENGRRWSHYSKDRSISWVRAKTSSGSSMFKVISESR